MMVAHSLAVVLSFVPLVFADRVVERHDDEISSGEYNVGLKTRRSRLSDLLIGNVDDKLETRPMENGAISHSSKTRTQALAALWRAPEWKDVKTISSCPQCGKKVVYLTFDDGPADTFPEFAQKLHDVGAKATFFWCAGWTKYKTTQDRSTLPEAIQKKKFRTFTADELRKGLHDGEFEVGSHTWSHAHLDSSSTSLDHEIEDADVLFNSLDLAKGDKITVFRPPYGEYSNEVVNYMKEHNKPYTIVLWDIDTLDWDVNSIHSTDDINSRIDAQWGGDSGGEAGHIILMHEGKNKADNVDSIQKVVEHIRKKCPDCEFESLNQCPLFVDKGASEGECPKNK